jgi:imidazolonepropionase-like amidohydrolase
MMGKCRSKTMKKASVFVFGAVVSGALLLAASTGTDALGRTGGGSDRKADNPQKAFAVRDVRVFDGEKFLPKATVVMQDGRFTAVGDDVAIPPGAEVISGEGKTLLPGLIDAHVHVWDRASLHQSLIFGVTTDVDMFTSVQFMKEIKKAQAKGAADDLAYMISPGILATAPGGHGTEYGVPIPTINDPARAQKFVDARIAEGSDFIKIILDDGSAYGLSRPTISKETLAALIQAAHRRGKMAVVHAASLQDCLDTLSAGADGLAHLYMNDAFDPDFGRKAARQKAFVIPTMTVLEVSAGIKAAAPLAQDPFISPFLKPSDLQSLRAGFPFKTGEANYRAAERALRQLKEARVPILAGTDSGNPGTAYGASLHREMELLVLAGLTPVEALQAATSVPAAKFKLEGRGSIRPGMIADAVLANGDPTQNIRATRDIVSVWKGGRLVDRAGYLEEAKKERAARETAQKPPVPPGLESGLISDFEGDKVTAAFGAGWVISTDSIMGGKSKAEMKLVAGGAQGSKGSLLMTGTDVTESPANWAGAMFSPGAYVMAPANLSAWKSISFWAKGDAKKFACLIFAQHLGWIPAIQFFTAGPEWQEYSFPFKDFGVDGSDIMGIFIGASGAPGEFALQVDDVRLKVVK